MASFTLKLQILNRRFKSWVHSFTAVDPHIRHAWIEYLDNDNALMEHDVTRDLVNGKFSFASYKPPCVLGIRYVTCTGTPEYVAYYRHCTDEEFEFPPYPWDEIVLAPTLLSATLISNDPDANNPPVDLTRVVKAFAGPRANFYSDAKCPALVGNPALLLYPLIPNDTYTTLVTLNSFFQTQTFIVIVNELSQSSSASASALSSRCRSERHSDPLRGHESDESTSMPGTPP